MERGSLQTKRMIVAVLASVTAACATASQSTGVVTTPAVVLPAGVPTRVGVVGFTGDGRIRDQAAEEFATGLVVLGFDVVERRQIDAVLSELAFQQSDYVSPETRQRLSAQLGLQGLFVGHVTGEASVININTNLSVKLVSIDTGRIVWAANARDPRKVTWSMDVKTSIGHTVKRALRLLREDLARAR